MLNIGNIPTNNNHPGTKNGEFKAAFYHHLATMNLYAQTIGYYIIIINFGIP